MKKLFCILLIFSLVFTISACGKVDLPPLPEVTEKPEAAAPASEPGQTVQAPEAASSAAGDSETIPAADQTPYTRRVTVNFRTTALEAYDPEEGSQLILDFRYDTPIVRIQGKEDASQTINAYVEGLDEAFYTGTDYAEGPGTGYNNMLMLAEDNYTYVRENGVDLPMEFASTRDVKVLRGDSQVLTLVFEYYDYTGGAHGNYGDKAYVFDTDSGKLLSLDDLSADPDSFRSLLTEKMLQQIEDRADLAETLYPDLKGDELKAAVTALLRDGSWSLERDAMVLFSDPYEIGPYAAGIIRFEIPYTELEGVLDARWIPFTMEGNGSFTVGAMSDIPDGSLEILDRVETSADGSEICLQANGTVFDVLLSSVYYEDYSNSFSEGDPLWFSSYMQNNAVQICTVVPEGIPDLMLSYRTSDGETKRQLISQSGLDGSYLLVDDSISAVG